MLEKIGAPPPSVIATPLPPFTGERIPEGVRMRSDPEGVGRRIDTDGIGPEGRAPILGGGAAGGGAGGADAGRDAAAAGRGPGGGVRGGTGSPFTTRAEDPSPISWPTWTFMDPMMAVPLTKVPFFDLRSVRTGPLVMSSTRAWKEETAASSRERSFVGARPIVMGRPVVRGTTLPAFGPLVTWIS